jgi:hypothetical protein
MLRRHHTRIEFQRTTNADRGASHELSYFVVFIMSHHKHNNNTKINGSSHHKYKREHYTRRDETPLETALESTWDEAQPLLKKIPLTVNPASFQYQPSLQSPIFCGHLVADLDSIAGAIGASVLYNGTPARASEVNAETQFALNYWKCKTPEYIVDLLAKDPHRNVCLVDFQQKSQLHEAIPQSSIVGIIDHHALQSSTIITERPIFVDIRPVRLSIVILYIIMFILIHTHSIVILL